jgi:hypothetical protein
VRTTPLIDTKEVHRQSPGEKGRRREERGRKGRGKKWVLGPWGRDWPLPFRLGLGLGLGDPTLTQSLTVFGAFFMNHDKFRTGDHIDSDQRDAGRGFIG